MGTRDNIDGLAMEECSAAVTEPAPYDVAYCVRCEVRPVYEHGCCKACHDTRWYAEKCLDCLVEGNFGPPKKPEPKRHFGVLPPVDLLNPGPDNACFQMTLRADRAASRALPVDHGVVRRPRPSRQRRTEPRQVRKRAPGHPEKCGCGHCDPSQPIVQPGNATLRSAARV